MKPHSSNPLPALLRYFRQKAGLTQQDVAAALSISRSGYANYEEGRNIPNIEQAIKLSELLNHDFLCIHPVIKIHAGASKATTDRHGGQFIHDRHRI